MFADETYHTGLVAYAEFPIFTSNAVHSPNWTYPASGLNDRNYYRFHYGAKDNAGNSTTYRSDRRSKYMSHVMVKINIIKRS